MQRVGAIVAGVALAVVSGVGIAAAAPDPYRPQQWNLDRIGAPTAWGQARGRGQVVAVVDSGVDLEHPDLVDRFVRRDDGTVLGFDVVDEDDVPQDPLGHGTMVAGIAVATFDNGVGIAGVAPRARLLPVRVLDEDGRGTASDVETGIRWAVDHGATVVNLSLESAMSGNGDDASPTVAAPVEAVEYAWDHGVVVVAAAGNSGNGFTDYPSRSPIVLVGATDRDDERTEFSDSGRDDLLMAPGVDIVSTWCREAGDTRCAPGTHTYGIASGTSFAAPHVAGAIAVLRSAGLDAAEAVQQLRATARDLEEEGRDATTGFGLVDLAAATDGVRTAGSSSPTPTPSPTATAAETPTTPATPTVTETPTTTESPSERDGEVTTPDAEATPLAVPPPSRPPGRTPWAVVASLLVAGTAVVVAGQWRHAG